MIQMTTPENRPDDRTRPRATAWLILGAFLLAMAPFPAGAAHHGVHEFEDAYVLGLAAGVAELVAPLPITDNNGCIPNPTDIECPVAGYLLCDPGSLIGVSIGRSIGGGCIMDDPVVVRDGDTVTVSVTDDLFGTDTFFGVCIDGNNNGICRPEAAEAATDSLVFNHCGGSNQVSFVHSGGSGFLYVFLMNTIVTGPVPDVVEAVCVATTGIVRGSVDSSTGTVPECSDGRDNDNDGAVDWPNDPGCDDANDRDERGDPYAVYACNDGWDNDGDGLTDYPADPGCLDAYDDNENDAGTIPLFECSDAWDNDGDGATDWPDDPSCSSPFGNEGDAPVPWGPPCNDGIDNDGDGAADWPADTGCTDARDTDERNECSDGIDNDGDGLIDWLNDYDCSGPQDTESGTVTTNDPCLGLFGGDGSLNDPWAAMLLFYTCGGTTDCPPPQTEIDRLIGGLGGTITPGDGDIPFVCLPECMDGIDNDGDGAVDWPADPGCVLPLDDDEENGLFQCSDGKDNDGDGLADYPFDPGCQGPFDDDETDPRPPTH